MCELNQDIIDQIQRLNQEAVNLYEQGQCEQAINSAQESCNLAESNSLTNNYNYADSQHILALLYESNKKHEDAFSCYKKAIEIYHQNLGINHSKYSQALNNLVNLYKSLGRYKEALDSYKLVQEIYRQNQEINTRNYANYLNNLALLHELIGQYQEALPNYKKALEILEEILGTEHPDYATTHNNLGNLYNSMGQYQDALPHYEKALEIRRNQLGIQHPDYAQSLNDLAVLYHSMSRYNEALSLYQEALETCSNSLGNNHQKYACFLNNFANLYQAMGQYNDAINHYKRAIRIFEETIGNQHPDYATCQYNLGSLYLLIGEYGEAINRTQKALKIYKKSLGTDHPDYGFPLINLAKLSELMGQYWKAKILYRQALRIFFRHFGFDHPTYGFCLNNLAALNLSIGEYKEAETLYSQAINIFAVRLGTDHPEYAASLSQLARLYVAINCPKEALRLMQRAADIDLKTISKIFSISTDNQRLIYLQRNYHEPERFLSLVFQHFPDTPEAVQSAYNLILRRKAIATETAILQKIALLSEKYAHLALKIKQWQQIRQQLAKRCLEVPSPEQIPYYRQEIDSLQRQADKLEQELNISELNLEQELQNADFRTIALDLPQGTTLIEFVRFDNYNFQAIPANGDAEWQEARYLAFILPFQASEKLTMIDLGEAKPIDELVKKFRTSVETGHFLRRGLFPGIPIEPDISPSIELRQLIFDKIKPYLTQELIICPDGELDCLPFEILPTDEGGYLMDEYRFHFLNVGRDILRFNAQITAEVTDSLVIANPDYNLGSSENTPSTAEIERRFLFQPHLRDLATFREGEIFGPLPGTEIEGEKIAQLLGVPAFTTTEALKSRVSKIQKSPYILHIATHGYFLEDITPDLGTIKQNLANLSPIERLQVGTLQNPMQRSGLAFAGVNTMLKAGILPEEAEDGLLTALDVQSINLAGTELVVMSACDTALGEIRAGVAIIGLRRSFIQAGAKTVISSLWKVHDVATTILMEYFYKYLLKEKLSKAEALREAKLDLQNLTIGAMRPQWLTEEAINWVEKHSKDVANHLRKLSQKSDLERPYEAPKYWAAFICLGNPAPLNSGLTQKP